MHEKNQSIHQKCTVFRDYIEGKNIEVPVTVWMYRHLTGSTKKALDLQSFS